MRTARNSGITLAALPHKSVLRRAILIFADSAGLDLARRGLPDAARSLLEPAAWTGEDPSVAEVHVFGSCAATVARTCQFHAQTGRNFAERFQNAIETINSLGYDEIVAIGRDCPQLRGSDIALAFAKLQDTRLVLGPDHRGGCYLIALRAMDRHLLRGIRWMRDTDCEQLRERCHASEIFLLPIKHDLDSWADLQLLAGFGDRISRLAAFIVRVALAVGREVVCFVDLAAQFVRVRGQLPPPVLAA